MVRITSVLFKQRRTFIDSVRITVRGGRGGNGLPKYGGMGGKGGDVYVEAVEKYSLANLKRNFPTQRFKAGPGGDSRRFQILGKPGDDIIIKSPPGVTAVDGSNIIGDLNKAGDKILLARGGCGGGPQNGYIGQRGSGLPLTLDLKLLADVGFVGYPNAGKSTLLKALSNAKPKIASYPFTTISPNIGMLEYDDHRKLSAADLPGLIEGAHMNYGMGHKFLKHCLRTKILLFVIDLNGFRLNPMMSHRSAFETVMLLNRELELYDEELVLKPALLAINKIDTEESGHELRQLQDDLKNSSKIRQLPEELKPSCVMNFDAIVPISAMNGTNVPLLKQKIRTLIDIHQEEKMTRYLEAGPSEISDQEIIYA